MQHLNSYVDKEALELFSTLEDTSDETSKPYSGDESLILKLEIGSSIQNLIIHENDDPKEAVSKFCEEHSLSTEVEKILLKKVLENITRQPSPTQVTKQVRFIKKGNFIKKEVPVRGHSALRSGTNISPCRNSDNEEVKYHESPVVRSKFKLDSRNRILGKPKISSGRIIKQFIPCSNNNQFSRSMMNQNLTPSTSCSLSVRNQSNGSVQKSASKRLFSDEQSQTILNRIRFLKIKKLFDVIDCDKCGVVSRESVKGFKDERLGKVLKPVFEEIVRKDLKLCLGEFENKIDLLLTRIPNNERMLILGVHTDN